MAEGGGEEQATNAPLGTPDVFISYASQDAAVADATVEALEKKGIRCWIAPRDVVSGAHYADAIIMAISGAKAMVVVAPRLSTVAPSATDGLDGRHWALQLTPSHAR